MSGRIMKPVDKCIDRLPGFIIGDDSLSFFFSVSVFFCLTRVTMVSYFLLPFSLYLGMQVDPCTLYLKYYLLWRLCYVIALTLVTAVVYGSQQSTFRWPLVKCTAVSGFSLGCHGISICNYNNPIFCSLSGLIMMPTGYGKIRKADNIWFTSSGLSFVAFSNIISSKYYLPSHSHSPVSGTCG